MKLPHMSTTATNIFKTLISGVNGFIFHSNSSHNPRFYQYLFLSPHLQFPLQFLNSLFKTHNQNPITLPTAFVDFSEFNHQLYPVIYDSLLGILPPNGYFEFSQMVYDNGVRTNKKPHNPTSIISSYIFHGKPNKAFDVFLELCNSNLNVDPGICNSLLAALSSNGYLEFAKNVFDTMLLRRISLNTVGLGVFMGALCRVSELENILSLLDKMKQRLEGIYGSVIAFSIIDGLCRVSKVDYASQALEELRIRDLKPDFIAYRVVIEGFRLMNRIDEVEKFTKRKRKLGVAPRMNEYKEFVFGLISERRLREATEFGEAIIDGNFPVDDELINALIGSVSEVCPDSAVSFCRYMIKMERFPTLLAMRNLSMNLCMNGKTDEMAGRVKEAYSVLKEMRKKGVTPDMFSYNSMMEACCREDLLRPAKKLWDEMFVYGCRGNLQTYNMLIQKFSETGEVEEAQHLFHHMLEKGVEPDTVTYTSLIKGLCREAKINAALEIFNKSMEQDIVIGGSTLNALIFSLCKEGNFHVASKVLRGLPPSDIDNTNSHIVLLKSLADAGEMKMAIEHSEWIRDTSPGKLPAISAELVASLSSALNSEPILQLLQVMRERGLVSKNDPWIDLCKESFSWS
eukprot:TRINITY_DN10483_c1_g1_i2.p1 TRINITY_DN10483_c1_g1~~TRINITY_DN10483_c1_g1_i2.p1  ORF type:complete len:627 (-),score=120.83 TRINITY_DN10483_c1_g1_i2:823-2703(-)